MKIILADDHNVVIRGLRALLSPERGFQVVAEAHDGQAALDLVERYKPDILVLELMMGSINGLEVIRRLGKKHPEVRVVVFSMYNDESYVLEALRLGVRAYVFKGSSDDSMEDLLYAIRQVSDGKRYLCRPLAEKAIQAYARIPPKKADSWAMLTAREKEIVQLVIQGISNTEIARRLCLCLRTVETHRSNANRKLGLRGHSELIDFVQAGGLAVQPA